MALHPDVKAYRMAGFLGDTEALFALADKETPELDFELFLDDLSYYISGESVPVFYDLGYHVEMTLGAEMFYFLEEFGKI